MCPLNDNQTAVSASLNATLAAIDATKTQIASAKSAIAALGGSNIASNLDAAGAALASAEAPLIEDAKAIADLAAV